MPEELVKSLYLHIPFCKRRCFYCDFAITTGGQDLQKRYVDTLCQEIELTARDFKTQDTPLETVFFGGGTPSLLSVAQVERILEEINKYFSISSQAEISLEANPGTVTLASLKGYKSAGVNRISLGAQAFQQELLDACGRGHSVEEIYDAVLAIQQAGINNFSLDLISGLPHQTLEQWQTSLKAAIALQPKHLSVYDLIVEPGTAFAKRYQAGASPLPLEESTVDMYLLAREELQAAKYEHYEISNYALPGFQCEHNLTYWRGLPFYGVGMAATSYVHRQRIDRPRKIRDYFQMIEAWQQQGITPSAPTISQSEELIDVLMQGLRLTEGLSLTKLQEKFGSDAITQVLQCLQPYLQKEWVQITNSNSAKLSLIAPFGWLYSDEIIAELFNAIN